MNQDGWEKKAGLRRANETPGGNVPHEAAEGAGSQLVGQSNCLQFASEQHPIMEQSIMRSAHTVTDQLHLFDNTLPSTFTLVLLTVVVCLSEHILSVHLN